MAASRCRPMRWTRPPELSGLRLDTLRVQKLLQLARAVHLANDVAAADEFTFDIKLRNCRPLAEFLDTLPEARIGQHINAFELDAELAQHLHNRGGEAALREDRAALHVKDDVILPDLLPDALEDGICSRGGHLEFLF